MRVLDVCDVAGAAAGRLLAALGAEVLRVELPFGDSVRARLPRCKPAGGGDPQSFAHIVHNAGKQSIVIDWCTEDGRRAALELMEGADIVLCSPGRTLLAALGIDPRTFAAQHADVALVVLDPFPADSPFDGATGEDLLLSATGAFAWLCGDAGGTPEHPKGQMAQTYAAISAALAGLAGLTARRLHGRAGWFELTGQEAIAFATAQTGDPNELLWNDHLPGRRSWAENEYGGVFRCADDKWVSVVLIGGRFDQLIVWLQEESIGDGFLDPKWLDYEYYVAQMSELAEAVAQLCLRYAADDVVQAGQSRLLMVMPVRGVGDLLTDPQLLDRGMFRSVVGSAVPLALPRAPLVFSRSRLPQPRRAPDLGAHDPAALDRWRAEGRSRARRHDEPVDRPPLPLKGLRVADFTWMLAGPLASRILADLGADVMRLESHVRRDLARENGTQPPGWSSLDTCSLQIVAASNKRSVSVNLESPDGVEIARRIMASSDIVIDNFRPGAMEKWGFGPDELLAQRPDLIVVTMPAVGSTGPHSRYGAIGPGVAAYGGLNMLTGFPENPPRGVGPLVADFFTPLFTVQGILAALHERSRSGLGQHVDSSMLEAAMWFLGTSLAESQLLGGDPPRTGNRDPYMAPHGFFPCAGDDEWIAVAIRSDAEWRAFCHVVPIPIAHAVAFARSEVRKGREDDLEQVVASATRRRSRWELAEALQAVGVAAAPLENVADHLSRDPGMTRRFSTLSHPFGYTLTAQNQYVRPEGEVVPTNRPPNLGEHTDEILRGVGLEEDEITDLFARGVLK